MELGQWEAARQALDTSASWALEPEADRQKVLARFEAAAAAFASAPHLVAAPLRHTAEHRASALPPSSAPAPTTTVPASPSPAPSPGAAQPGTEVRPSPVIPTPRAAGAPPSPKSPVAALEPQAGTIEIVSQPTAAVAYVTTRPIGSTDPQTGRILKSGIPAGRHRVRVSRDGHEDVLRDIDVPPGGRTTFHASLRPRFASPPDQPPWAAFGAVALALFLLIAWSVWRRPPPPAGLPRVPTPRPGQGAAGESSLPTPPGLVNPGARHDELGQEWFGDYRLLGMLGRGGMASVYKAERRTEVSALKRPLGTVLEDPEFVDRFQREADIGRTLNHPNIVRILERGLVERVPYFAMELLGRRDPAGLHPKSGSGGAPDGRFDAGPGLGGPGLRPQQGGGAS